MEESFIPTLRFLVFSDAHTQEREACRSIDRIRAMLSQAYRRASACEAYPGLDAAVSVGDLTDNGRPDQFEGFFETMRACLKPETRLLAVSARAHDGWTVDRAAVHAICTKYTGEPSDFCVTVGGYRFIGLSASNDDSLIYDEGQVKWLDDRLREAAEEDSARPVFVFHHEHVRDTVYGSTRFDGWGETFFSDVLPRYPQAVDFSGHSHYPVNHPLSLWQGAFTAVGTGAIHYAEFTVDDTRTYHPADNGEVCACWLVEADAAHRLRLTGIDVLADETLCEYTLPNPADPANRAFSPGARRARAKAPVFRPDAALRSERDGEQLRFAVSAAASRDGDPVVLYRLALSDASGETVFRGWTLPPYYRAAPVTEVTLLAPAPAAGRYTARVTAENAFGMPSEPVLSEIEVL